MSSNFIKGGFVQNSGEAVKIDNNELMRKRLEALRALNIVDIPDAPPPDGFVEGLDPVTVSRLVEDADSLGEDEADAPKIIHSSADARLEEANAEAERIVKEAMEQADAIREEAKKEGFDLGHTEGYDAGYEEGKLDADKYLNEELQKQQSYLENTENELAAEYKEMEKEMEPMLIDKLCEIYEHIIGISLEDSKNTVVYLLNRALSSMDGSEKYIIHVSSEDAEFVKSNIEILCKASGAGPERIEIVPDNSLSKNGCLIETDGGIFDIGLDTQLDLLSKQLKIISING